MNKTVYIAGPMRGIPQFNFPEFYEAARHLRAIGYDVISPAEHDIDNGFDPIADNMTGNEDLAALGFDLKAALSWDLQQVMAADFIAVLDGWERSSGSRAEIVLAHAVGTKVVPVSGFGADGSIDTRSIIFSAPSSTAPTVSNKFVKGSEIRTVSRTGGEKGVKDERFDLIPIGALTALARHYGVGARKYADNQWRKGYEWSKSYAALNRHLTAWWSGEDIDDETSSNHMAAVAWHAFTLLTFIDEQPDFDDRFTMPKPTPAHRLTEPAVDRYFNGGSTAVEDGDIDETFPERLARIVQRGNKRLVAVDERVELNREQLKAINEGREFTYTAEQVQRLGQAGLGFLKKHAAAVLVEHTGPYRSNVTFLHPADEGDDIA